MTFDNITYGDYVKSKSQGFKGFVKEIWFSENRKKTVDVDCAGVTFSAPLEDLFLVLPGTEKKTVDDIPSADEPRKVEASPEVELKDIRIHSEIFSRLLKQTVKGVKKYGDPVHHDNLSAVEWIDHAIDESVDQIVYLTALKHKLQAAGEGERDDR